MTATIEGAAARPPSPPTPSIPPDDPSASRLRRTGVSIVATALLVDLAIQTRAAGTAGAVAVLCLGAGLVFAGPVTRPAGRFLIALAVVVSSFLALRASPWLIALDVSVVLVLLALAASADQFGRPFDTRFTGMARRMWESVGSVLTAPPRALAAVSALLPRGTGTSTRLMWSVIRGLALAIPIVAIIGVSLAWADPVFASMFEVDVDVTSAPPHLFVVVAALWVAAGFFVQAGRPPTAGRASTRSIGTIEGLVVMGGLTGVYSVFAVSRFLAARRGPAFIIETTGLTYAEYARSGFFQLLWVAALTAVILVWLRALVRLPTPAARRLFAGFGAVSSLLTLVVVHAAIVGLQYYEDAFGLTLLRFYSSTVAWWLGAVFVLVTIAFALNTTRVRDWLPTAVGCSAVAAVLVVNLVNPDAVVVERNLERATTGAEFDAPYAATLSADAIPALVDGLPTLAPETRQFLETGLCVPTNLDRVDWNLAERRADRSLDELCE